MKRHKNENEFLAMVGTGEQEILSLISLLQEAADTESTIRLNRKKKQLCGASSSSKEKAASGVLYCPMQQTPRGHLQWQAKGQRWGMMETWRFYRHSKIPPEQTFQTMRTTSTSWKATSIGLFFKIPKRKSGWGTELPSFTGFSIYQSESTGLNCTSSKCVLKNGKTQVNLPLHLSGNHQVNFLLSKVCVSIINTNTNIQ